MVYGMDAPFGFGVYNSQEACFADQTHRCNMAALFFLLLGIGLGLAEYFKNMSYEAMKQTAAMNLRKQLFSSLLKQEVGWFDETQNTSGALTSRLAADTALVSGVLGPQMGSAFQSMVTLVVGMIVAFTASWRLALSVLGFLPLMVISAKIQNDLFMGLSDDASSSSAIANQLCSESIQGIRTVRAFAIEKQVLQLYQKLVSDGQGKYKKAFTSGLGAGASQMLMFALYWMAFFYGGARLPSSPAPSPLQLCTRFPAVFKLSLQRYDYCSSSRLAYQGRRGQWQRRYDELHVHDDGWHGYWYGEYGCARQSKVCVCRQRCVCYDPPSAQDRGDVWRGTRL